MVDTVTDPDTVARPLVYGGPPSAISPWLWLSVSTLALCGLLFVSFRRAKSIELYHAASQALSRRLALCWPVGRSNRGVHLDVEAGGTPRRRRSRSPTSDLSSPSSSGGRSPRTSRLDDDDDEEEEDDDDEESPFPSTGHSSTPFRSRRNYTLDTAPLRPLAASALSALGWTADRATRALSGAGDQRDGFARMFWGLRDSERTGGIRLGEESPRGEQRPPPPTPRTTGPVPQGKAARVLGYSPRPAAPRFELDDDGIEPDEREDDGPRENAASEPSARGPL